LTIQLSRAQFAIVAGLTLAMFTSGVVAGAAGATMIIGSEANNAGSANTQLLTNSSVVAFKLLQNGPGTALMGYTTPITGTTRGVYGRVDSPNGDGVQGRNAGPAGTGAALRGYGGENAGAVLSSDADYPLELTGPVNIAPMTVNSSIKVANLNADQLDGKTSTDFVLNETVTGHYSCNGIALVPTTGSYTYGWTLGRNSVSNSDIAYACQLILPDGALITALRGFVYDTSATEDVGGCFINRFAIAGTTQNFIGTTGSSGEAFAGGNAVIEDTTIDITVDNSANAYALYCFIGGTGTDVAIKGVQVDYEVTGLPVP
jgi:hypothetical protein